MTPAAFLTQVIRPGLTWLEQMDGPRVTPEAERFLLAVAKTESNLTHRFQVLNSGAAGPARSYYQFEQEGVRCVLTHDSSKALLRRACEMVDVEPETLHLWRAIEGHDQLATVLARLLLWTDPFAVPRTTAEGWQAYAVRLWKPGKPDRVRWAAAWPVAEQTVGVMSA